jgi:hypothetical protein
VKKTLALGASVAIAALFAPIPAFADVPDGGTAIPTACTLPYTAGWYVNSDEKDRMSTSTKDGFVFEGNQLMHFEAETDVEHLKPGTFKASPAPDQDSFFSVEVINEDNKGYGTLRWNTKTDKWEMSTGGQFFDDADPTKVVDHFSKGHLVFSFGVGYTANPPGTVKTTVTEVDFDGNSFDLTCKPSPSPSTSSASPKPSTSAKPSSSKSSSHAVVGGGSDSNGGALAITGSKSTIFAGIGGGVVVLGGILIGLSVKRRRTRFQA